MNCQQKLSGQVDGDFLVSKGSFEAEQVAFNLRSTAVVINIYFLGTYFSIMVNNIENCIWARWKVYMILFSIVKRLQKSLRRLITPTGPRDIR